MAASGGHWKSGNFVAAGGATAAAPEMTPGERIRKLGDLGRMSDRIGALNARAEKARARLNAQYRKAPERRKGLERDKAQWREAMTALESEWQSSRSFSRQFGLTELPKPTGLQQR